ncbi:MAG: copper homeostasis protein CutC [Planctomycetota bacterium]
MARSELLCTDLRSVEIARDLGADRVELCAALEVGGVTPGSGMLAEALRVAAAGSRRDRMLEGLEVVVLTRPRRGDFALDPADARALLADVAAARDAGAAGVALGVLHPDGRVDGQRTRELVAAARPLAVTFHRALDHAPDLDEAVATAIEAGVDRVLTSGGARSAWEGRAVLRRLVEAHGAAVEVVAAGGVDGANARALLEVTGVPAIHGSCSVEIGRRGDDPASAPVPLGAAGASPEDVRRTLDERSALEFVRAARGA